MNKTEVRARRKARREAQRSYSFDGGLVADLVAARLAGMPDRLVKEFQALDGRDRYNKRRLFTEWIELIDRNTKNGNPPDFMPDIWLSWEVLMSWKRIGTGSYRYFRGDSTWVLAPSPAPFGPPTMFTGPSLTSLLGK